MHGRQEKNQTVRKGLPYCFSASQRGTEVSFRGSRRGQWLRPVELGYSLSPLTGLSLFVSLSSLPGWLYFHASLGVPAWKPLQFGFFDICPQTSLKSRLPAPPPDTKHEALCKKSRMDESTTHNHNRGNNLSANGCQAFRTMS